MPDMEFPVAQVAVDVPLANLDRPFDYQVPPELDQAAQPGVRVRVRFAGRLRDGLLLARVPAGERVDLAPLAKVVSAEPVLTPAVAELVRAVADHYAGGFADVVRGAVPPRHAATERAAPVSRPEPNLGSPVRTLALYPGSAQLLGALESGGHPRAAWTPAPASGPAGDWRTGFLEAAEACLLSGRSALLLAPDARSLAQLSAAATQRFGRGSFAELRADTGPAARYRQFLAVSRGAVRLVIGTRAAVFAPVHQLGLIALWDDGNDGWSEPHAPYWHAREVAALRAHQARCGLLVAGQLRTAEVQQLVGRGWLAELSLTPAAARAASAAVRTAGEQGAWDLHAETSRLPRDAFAAVRTGLAAGPVLIQVPRAGYQPVVVCADCRTPATCPSCHQRLTDTGPTCANCGHPLGSWRCAECGGHRRHAPVSGIVRTAEELGRAFPGTVVRQASAEKPLTEVDDTPALILATPGAAPRASHGYAAAILLDAEQMLGRAELRAGEEALRRWLAVTSLVRAGEDGGTVMLVADPSLREAQALLRLDPVGYAERELAERRSAGLPPAAKVVTIEGSEASLAAMADRLELPPGVDRLGPFEVAQKPDPLYRFTLRAELSVGAALVAAVRSLVSVRSAKKEEPVRVRVDPQVMD